MNLEPPEPDARPEEPDSTEEFENRAANPRVRLSVLKCRSALGPACGLTDSEILELRDALYDFANVALETYKNGEPLP